MAVIFMDGCDSYLTADILKRWTNAANATVGPSYSRAPSGQGLLPGTGTGSQVVKSFGANYAQGIFGFAFQIPSGSLATKTIFTVWDGITEQCSIRTNASSVLTVNQAATVKATGSTVLSAATWYYVEFKATVHGTTGVAELRLNGASEIASTSSLDLTGTANNYWNGCGPIGSVGGSTAWFDDIYVIDPTTGSNINFLGPVRCVALAPAAPGNYAQWTPNGGNNMGCVSETYEDGDTSFNQSSTAAQIDTFAFQDLPASAGSVFAVQHLFTARQDGGAARTIRAKQRTGAVDYNGTTQVLSTSYQMLTEIDDLNPATAVAWVLADVNGAEFGYELVS